MKIGLSARALTLGYIDGIGTYTLNLLKQYQELQHEVIPLLYPSFKRKIKDNVSEGSIFFPLPYSLLTFASLFTSAACILTDKIGSKISLFHATDYHIPRFKKTPVVASLHDALVHKRPDWYNTSLRSIKNNIMKKTTNFADRIIVGSSYSLQEVVDYWDIEASRIDVIYNGITDWWFGRVSDAEKKRVLKKFNLNSGFILFVGTLQPKKNVNRIIQAYKALPLDLRRQHRLVLVGKNGWQTEELMPEINKLISTNTGSWLEYVSAEELRALYQSAKLFLFPSLHEGFGIPILEAFASKIPVITSNITAMPEVASDAAYLVNPYELNDMANAMEVLLTDDVLCQTYISKGSERVKDFSWRNCAIKTLEVYKKLVT